MMRLAWNVVVVLAVASCGGSSSKPVIDLGVPDLAASVDLAGGALGAACSSDGDCHEGKTPTCFVSTLFNQSSKLKTPDGYCSSGCTTDDDCGADGTCIKYSDEATSWCFAKCAAPADCRTGYACFTGNLECFPTGNLDCDPTSANGTCDTAPLTNPGGCLRAALGTGMVGHCYDGCTPGVGSCPPSDGENRQCIVYNNTHGTDPDGTLFGDTFHGAVCIASYSSNADGAECAYNGGDYVDACADDEECYLASAFHGDNRCHKLCTGGSDAGESCPSGQSCQDVFGLLTSATSPIGLCH